MHYITFSKGGVFNLKASFTLFFDTLSQSQTTLNHIALHNIYTNMCTEQYTHFYCIDCRTCIRKAYEWEICEEALKSESKSMGSCGYTNDGEVAIASEYCQQCPPDERKWGKVNLCGGLGSEA
jgi:hypothetical protein